MTSGNELVFELTPRNEGFIFCRNGEDMMSNVEEIVGRFVGSDTAVFTALRAFIVYRAHCSNVWVKVLH